MANKAFAHTSVQFSRSVMSDTLRPHGLQHARPPCPSPTPRAYSNSCPLCWWCHPIISSSVVPVSSGLWSFPASGSFLMSRFLASGGQSIGVSASASVFPMTVQDWFSLGCTGWISLQSKGLSRVFSNTTVQKHSVQKHSAFFIVQLSHPYMTAGKTIALTRRTFVGKVRGFFSSSSLLAIRMVSSVYLRLLIFLLEILIPACASCSLAFCMMYSAYKLNKQGDNIQPWCIPFLIWNQSVFLCPVLTVASWPTYRFLRRLVRWSGIPISWRLSTVCCDLHSQRLWHNQ